MASSGQPPPSTPVRLTAPRPSSRRTLPGHDPQWTLLNAWGWSVVGTIATRAGIILIIIGASLLLLPLLNWQINVKRTRPGAETV